MSFGTNGSPHRPNESMPNGDSPEEVVELLHEDDESSEPVEEQTSSTNTRGSEPAQAMDAASASQYLVDDASRTAQNRGDFDHQNAINALRALDQLRSERDGREYARKGGDDAFATPNVHASTYPSANDGYLDNLASESNSADLIDEEESEEEGVMPNDGVMHNDGDEEAEEEGYDLTNENYSADDVGNDGSDDISNESEADIDLSSRPASAPALSEANQPSNDSRSDSVLSVDARNDIPGMADHIEFPRSRATSPFVSLSPAASRSNSLENGRLFGNQSSLETDHEPRVNVADLKSQIRDLEAIQWNLERQLHQMEHQHESARQAQRRYAQLAEEEASSLRQLRSTSARERASYEARIVELQVAANHSQLSAQSAERSLTTLRERFTQQTDVLTELRERFNQAERKQIEYETRAKSAQQAESRAQRQLELLRSQLHLALEDAAAARADLDIQAQSLAEMRAEARSEALAAIAREVPGSEASDEQVWRKQYIALRREMDAVAAEFERQGPEIAALQTAYDEAEKQLAEHQANLSQCQTVQHQLEDKLQLSERRAMDLMVFQQLSETQLNDLRRQVLALLTEKALSSVGSPPLTPEDEDELMRLREAVSRMDDENTTGPESTGAGRLITERLLLFRDVAELQLQNESLLKACRELALQLDPESQAKNGALQLWETQKNNDLLRATEALEELESKFAEVKEQLLSERTNRQDAEMSISAKEEEVSRLRKQISELETRYQTVMQSAADNSVLMGSMPNSGDATAVSKEENLLRHQISMLEERMSDMRREAAQYRDDYRDLTQDLTSAKAATARAEEKLANLQQTIADLRVQLANEQHRNSVLQQENQLLAQREQQLIVQLSQAQTEAVGFKRKVARLQQELADAQAPHSASGSSSGSTKPASQLEQRLEEQIQSLRSLLTAQPTASSLADIDSKEFVAIQKTRDEAIRRAEEAELRLEEALGRVCKLEQEISELQSTQAKLSSQAKDAAQAVESERQQAAAQLQTQSTEYAKVLAERDETIAKMRDREAELVQQINDVEDQVTEAADKAEEVIKGLKLQLDQEKERVDELNRQLNDGARTAKIQEELASKLRMEIESDLRQQFDAEAQKNAKSECVDSKSDSRTNEAVSRPASAEDVKGVPAGDISAFKSALSNFVDTQVLDALEKDIENREHVKTQAYFLQQLQETKEASFKEGQDCALKQNEARKKLQQKQSEKLKQQIETLQAEIEAQKKVIRRLKFGTEGNNDAKPQNEEKALPVDTGNGASAFGLSSGFPNSFNFNAPVFTPQSLVKQQPQQGLQQDPQQDQMVLQPPGNSFNFSQSSFSDPSSSSFGFSFPSFNSKRTGDFEDNDAKKRRED